MGISDAIAAFIVDMLNDDNGEAEFSRNALAIRFSCVPSQINYVISTRFSPEHGYVVESRRGGGGYVRISRVKLEGAHLLMHIVNTIGGEIDQNTVTAFLRNMLCAELITEREASLMSAATCDSALRALSIPVRDRIRADIFKQCLVNLA